MTVIITQERDLKFTKLFFFQTQNTRPTIGQKPQISPKPRFSDTIEITLPAELPTTGHQTWPLKNKVITTDAVKKTAASKLNPSTPQYNTLPSKAQTSSYIDEVALEEKRLINALKNGVVINEEPPPTIAPVKQKDIEREGTRWGLRNCKRPEQQVPHPELTSSQRQHIRLTASNPVRPFLTKGSVAERVLIFERCPSDLLLDKRVRTPVIQPSKPQVRVIINIQMIFK